MPKKDQAQNPFRLAAVELDEASISASSQRVEHERRVAIFDLIEDNRFELAGGPPGPYKLRIGMAEHRLAFTVMAPGVAEPAARFLLSLNPFARVVKDYFLVCENYFEAIKTAPPSRIEALDMGRRALHDEGGKLLLERLHGKVTMDTPTARRLFTLICALRWKG
jgi:uncharacterized protein (UPF0262 family)